MEHTLNRQTTTILTYINQGRRPAAFPVFPARPPRRRARMAPFSAACPGAAGRPAGAPPAPMGIRRLAPGPVVMALPIPRVLLQCLFSRLISIFPQCGRMVFPGLVIMQSVM